MQQLTIPVIHAFNSIRKILPLLAALLFINLNAQTEKAKEGLENTITYAERVEQNIDFSLDYVRKASIEESVTDKQYLMKRAKSEAEYTVKYAQYVSDEIYKILDALEDARCSSGNSILAEIDANILSIKASAKKALYAFKDGENATDGASIEAKALEGEELMKTCKSLIDEEIKKLKNTQGLLGECF